MALHSTSEQTTLITSEITRASYRHATDLAHMTLVTSNYRLDKDHVVDASKVPTTPLRFCQVFVLTSFRDDCSRSQPIEALLPDTGGGQSLLGEGLEQDLLRNYPECIQVSQSSTPARVLEIAGLGAVNLVLRHVELRLLIAGGAVRLTQLPVISGFFGLVLGNQVNLELSATYAYSRDNPGDAIFCYQHDYYGRLSCKAEYIDRRHAVAIDGAFPTAGAVMPLAFSMGTTIVPAAKIR